MAIKYPLEDILRIRVIREDRAQRELKKAMERLEELKAAVAQLEKSLAEYKVWRVQEEQRRWDAIMKKMVNKEKLDELRYEISLLRDEELKREKQLEDAKKTVEEGEKAVEQARENYHQAQRSHQKIGEHKKIWMDEEQKNQEYILDLAMEDVKVKAEHEDALFEQEANEEAASMAG